MRSQLFAIIVFMPVVPALAQPFADAREDVIANSAANRTTPFQFSADDQKLLEEVQHGAFLFFWNEVGAPAKLAKDRVKAPVASIASVGFQLSSLPIGVEHGWITRAQGAERAAIVLRSLIERDDNKYRGIYIHFPDHNTGGPSDSGYEKVASTVDTALLIAGAIPAGEYFGGDVAKLVDRLVADADWHAYSQGPDGFISMGWRPEKLENIAGKGEFLKWDWHDAADEERLIYFLAAGAPDADHAVDPATYYKLRRPMKRYQDMAPYVVSYPGGLFTYFFSQCWIDYRSLAADDPAAFGVDAPRVDWFENSRRAVLTHRRRCIDNADKFKTLAEDRWGLSACVGKSGYIVPKIRPNTSEKDEWFEGTVAPYAAASSIMFTPKESMAAIRAFRTLTDGSDKLAAWHDIADGGYGLVDAFNLDQDYKADDYVGIDQGPLLLAIENARTGLIWRLFMRHSSSQRAAERLKWTPLPAS